jgi:Tfp pilus assembly protein PilN
MIKVNLLRSTGLSSAPTMSSSGGELSAADEKKLATGKAVVILVFPLLLFAYEYSNISALKTQLDTIDTEAKAIEAKKAAFGDAAPKVDKFKKMQRKIDRQMVVIKMLAKNRLTDVKALDAIQELTPNQVWFESLTIDNGIVSAKGYATSNSELQPFYNRISSSPLFSNFNLVTQDSTPVDVNGRPALKFEIRFSIGRPDQS